MQENYARHYRELYRCHWWWRAREEFIVGHLQRLRAADGSTGDFGNILDVGCGDGLLLDRLRDFGEPEGIDAEVDGRRSQARVTRFEERIVVGMPGGDVELAIRPRFVLPGAAPGIPSMAPGRGDRKHQS